MEEKVQKKCRKVHFFCIFLSGRAASFPSQAPLENKKRRSPALNPAPIAHRQLPNTVPPAL